jgi:uncharacterized membrane-anchored protein|tara:strand:+ start:360 stop:527 length:168 start_codon:yes stop_codon:yes gene_type:complete
MANFGNMLKNFGSNKNKVENKLQLKNLMMEAMRKGDTSAAERYRQQYNNFGKNKK